MRSIMRARAAQPRPTRRAAVLRRLENDHIGHSRKFVSNHVYPVTGPDQPMCEVGACPVWDSAWVSAGPAPAPSGVVTFLFTDVEGSTRRWEADAYGMRAALAAHDQVLRSAIEAHGGWLFKHTGDGVCAAFASPKCAVDAAVAAQRPLELPVRMGLATGEAELRDGDYFGAVLNRAARVMAAGHGGQVLLDGTTAELCSSIDLIALGPRRLRDIAKPVEMFQVLAVGLRSEFPPLKTLDAAPGNLRRQTTSLVGRESELAEVQEAVKAHRVLTLTGVGGVGKTRLATEVAARLADEFPDGSDRVMANHLGESVGHLTGEGAEVAVGTIARHGGQHCAAAGVAEDHHQRHGEHAHPELDAPERHPGERLARRAHREHLADALIQHHLREDAGVHAAKHHGPRVLPVHQSAPSLGIERMRHRAALHEPPVPRQQGTQGIRGISGSAVGRGVR